MASCVVSGVEFKVDPQGVLYRNGQKLHINVVFSNVEVSARDDNHLYILPKGELSWRIVNPLAHPSLWRGEKAGYETGPRNASGQCTTLPKEKPPWLEGVRPWKVSGATRD